MELLSIDENRCAYFARGAELIPISQIEKEDILHLVETIATSESVEMVACDDKNPISNPIEQTIYENLYATLHDLSEKMDIYLKEIDEKFETFESKMSLRNP